MLNVLVLMAGESTAFKEAGYLYPKPLIEIEGDPLLRRVVDNLASIVDPGKRLIFLIRKEDNAKYHIGAVLNLLVPGVLVLEVQQATGGAACTALLAVEHVNNDDPLVITNGDQVLETDLQAVLNHFINRNLNGGIAVFEDVHPRWSFVKCDANGLAVETAEKRPISKLATAGFYYFQHGSDFVTAAMTMIKKDAHVGGRFFVCPAYNEMILRQRKIGVFQIPRNAYFSLATPQGVQAYADHLKKIARPDIAL